MPVTVLSALCTYPANYFYSRILVDALFQNGSSWIFRVFWSLTLKLPASRHAYFSHLDKNLPRDTAKAHLYVTDVFHCVEMLTPLPPNPRAAGACILVSLCVIKVASSVHAIMKRMGALILVISVSHGPKGKNAGQIRGN